MTAGTAPDGSLRGKSCRCLFWQVREKSATERKQFAASSIVAPRLGFGLICGALSPTYAQRSLAVCRDGHSGTARKLL